MPDPVDGPEASGAWLPPRPPGTPPAGPGPPAGPPYADPGNVEGAWSIGLSSAGFGLLLVSSGLLCVVSLPLGIAGWVLGAKARARLRSGQTRQHASAAEAGWVVGIGCTVLSAVALAVIVALIATHHGWLGRHA